MREAPASAGHANGTAEVKKPGSPDGPTSPGGPPSPTPDLSSLALAELCARHREAFGTNPPTTDRRIIERRLVLKEREERRAAEGRERAEAARVAREQAMHIGVARGTHCILRCDDCHQERIVPVSTRRRLLRLSRAGAPARFDCADCRDRFRRRAGEREALAKTVADIERKKELKARRG